MNQLEKQIKEASDIERTGIATSILALPKYNNVSKGCLIEVAKTFQNDNNFLLEEIELLKNEIGALKIKLQQERNAKSIEIALVDDEYD